MFLDSHCECNVGWLEPLLERIHHNQTTVVCPVIDVISWEKLEYSTVRGPPGVRGGFNWALTFKWKKIPDYEQKRRGYDETREVKSPTMAGGLFAIDRKFFFHIGSYDIGMDIWGAENLEISFRVSLWSYYRELERGGEKMKKMPGWGVQELRREGGRAESKRIERCREYQWNM